MLQKAKNLAVYACLIGLPFGLGWYGGQQTVSPNTDEAPLPTRSVQRQLEHPSPRVAEWLHAYLVRESSRHDDRDSAYSRGLQRHIDELDSQARLVESTIVDHPNPCVLEDAVEFLRQGGVARR